MKLVRLIRGWWIVRHCPPVGPYKTKQEAQQVMRGLRRFYRSQGISNPCISNPYHKGDKTMQTTKTAMATLFGELGFPMADKWNVAQLKRKAKTLPKLVDEDTSLETEGSQALLDELLAALENNDEIEISEDEEAAPAKKAGKGKPGKAKAKAAAEEEEEDNSEEEEDESEDEEDSEEEDEEPAPKKKAGKDKPAAAGKKAPPKPGVIASIIEFLKAASEEKPLSKDKIVERLAKRFPDRDPESMGKTVAVQVPNRLKSDKGLNIKKNDRGYWIAGKKKK